MKVTIRDSKTLLSVSPSELMAYASSLGMEQVEVWGDKAVIWHSTTNEGEDIELLVPLRRDLGDYTARINDALQTLEYLTGKSQLQILANLSSANSDIVRVHSTSVIVEDGTIPLRGGRDLLSHTYNMMMAAASSSVEKRPSFPAHKSEQASGYMRNVRMGQTERSSFILTILSPVAPLPPNVVVTDKVHSKVVAEPFERIVTQSLAVALDQAIHAAVESAKLDDLEPFKAAVSSGVNANLCDAMVGLYESGGEGAIEVSFDWSLGRPSPKDIPKIIILNSHVIPIIKEASDFLKQKVEPENREVEGFILKLSRPRPDARGGTVTIQSYIDSAWRQVRMTLQHFDYQNAVNAHERYQPVACVGLLEPSGNAYTLKNPIGFTVLQPHEFDAGARATPDKSRISRSQLNLFD